VSERVCTRCGTRCVEACPTCTAEWEDRSDAASMSPEERVAEFESWGSVLEIDFPKLHKRIEELVGRPVWTHELARPELLRHEILTGDHPTLEGVMAKLPADKPVIVVETDGPS
jgi:ferredoxin